MRGLGALLTTQGVGELSAINGIGASLSPNPMLKSGSTSSRLTSTAAPSTAGAYAERVPVIHVAGVASTKLQKSRAVLHHTLGDGFTNVFEQAHSGITCARAFLQKAEDAASEIDRILLAALTTARPAYLTLPTDLVFVPVDKKRLETPIIPDSVAFENKDVLPTGKKVQDETKKRLEFVVKEIERLWEGAEDPIVLVRRRSTTSLCRFLSVLLTLFLRAATARRVRHPLRRRPPRARPRQGYQGQGAALSPLPPQPWTLELIPRTPQFYTSTSWSSLHPPPLLPRPRTCPRPRPS